MIVLLFLAGPGPYGQEFLEAVSRIVPAGRLEVVRNWQDFAENLQRLNETASIVIIWNPTHDDLRQAADLGDPLQRRRVLLALADQDDGTVLLAHRLLPAFISYVEDGSAGLLSVVGKLVRLGSQGRGG